jgi:hypothetical protein
MRFALKTLILAMMAMFIATLCMAQEAAPSKGQIWFQPKLHAYAQFYSAKNEDSAYNSADSSKIQLDDFELSAGFTAGNVMMKGAIRIDSHANTGSAQGHKHSVGVAYGDCYGQWNFIGPAFVRAGLYEQPWGKSRNSMTYTVDSWAHHTSRTGNLEFGAEKIGGMITVALGVFVPSDYNNKRYNMINALYGYVDFNKKISMVNLGISLGISTNAEGMGPIEENIADIAELTGGPGLDESTAGMFAELSTDFDFGLHFMANMFLVLSKGTTTYPVKATFHFELGYKISKLTAAVTMNMASYDNDPKNGDQWYLNKAQAGLILYYGVADNLTLKFDTNYGFQRKDMTLRLGFEWVAKKVFDL